MELLDSVAWYQRVPAPGFWADAILLAHGLIVAFVVGGQMLILLGGWRGWNWVRHFWFRVIHLGTIGFVIVQTWLERLCPLTIWEQDLRRAAGQDWHDQSFIEHWIGQVLFHDLPWWVFIALYTAFGVLVVASWWWIPPGRRAGSARDPRSGSRP